MTTEGVDIPALAHALGWSAADLRLLGDLHDVSRYIEDEIERRGLADEYVNALVDILGVYGERSYYDWDRDWGGAVWDVIRATPEQRALAFLRAVRPT